MPRTTAVVLDNEPILDVSRPPRAPTPKARAPRNDYADLKRRVYAQGLMNRQYGYYARKGAVTAALLAVGLGVLLVGAGTWWVRLVDAVFLAFVFGQIALLGHDLAHLQIIPSGRANTVVGLLVGNFLLGVSRGWWRDNHSAHHAHPNEMGEDPNIDILLLATTPEQALGRPRWVRWVIRHQVPLLFPIFSLEFFSMHQQSIAFAWRRGPGASRGEGWLLVGHFAVYFVLLPALIGVGEALTFALVHRLVAGMYLGSIFAPNHKGMPLVERGDGRLDFLREQVLTARNVRGGAVTDLVYGGLNYQIEHHLFPTMPRNRLRRAQPVVRAFCAERGIVYYETGVVQSFREIMGHFGAVSAALA